METLEKEQGRSLILLTYHVHYWDSLGWKDSFSDSKYTQLQSAYATIFGQDNIYTPEMVVQGEVGFNGSDLQEARREIETRANTPRSAIVMQLKPGAERSVLLSVNKIPDSSMGSLVAVIYENADPVAVGRGENRGATMSGRYAVRKIVPLTADSGSVTITLRRDATWNPQKLGVAVLVRDEKLAIRSAAAVPWPSVS
jgi:hypothetical protein